MDTKYATLFSELAQSSIIILEQVIELDRSKNDTQGESTAKAMRDDFYQLKEKIQEDPNSLIRNDYIKLLVGAYVIINNITEKIAAYQTALQGYKLDLIPKLQRIFDETTTDEEVSKLVNEIF